MLYPDVFPGQIRQLAVNDDIWSVIVGAFFFGESSFEGEGGGGGGGVEDREILE